MQERLGSLLEAVAGAERVLILPHNDPDPDAIASALALRHLLAEKLGVEGYIAYKGIVGRAENKALAAEMADLLLRLEGMQWVLCIGVYKDDLILSVRSRSRRGGAGELAQKIVGEQGSAGGHETMAGGQIPLASQDSASLARALSQQALEYLKVPPTTTARPLI